jgi:spore germination cell wall hydrolase CwlJ-like protein
MLDLALMCLSLNVFHEARGEAFQAQLAVAMATLNRAKATGQDLCDVVLEPGQFSWTTTGIQRGVRRNSQKGAIGERWRLRTSRGWRW